MDERGVTDAVDSIREVNVTLISTAVELTIWLDLVTKALRYLAEGDPEAAKGILAVIEESGE